MKSVILLTGGTGSFGNAFISYLLSQKNFKGVIRIFSRNESKQLEIQKKFNNDARLRFLIGDVRDLERVLVAMQGVDVVVHAASLRQVFALEYNPFEAINTNILGTQHIIRAAITTRIGRVIFLSSDKVCQPLSLYAATKLTAEKLFVQSNSYTDGHSKFSVIRFCNTFAYDGIISTLLKLDHSKIAKTNYNNSTHFWMNPTQGAEFVSKFANNIKGGEILVPKSPSIKITELASALAPHAKEITDATLYHGDAPEVLITKEEIKRTLEYQDYFLIQPESNFHRKARLKQSFTKRTKAYSSDTNDVWLSPEKIQREISRLHII